jgi:hypothetical protein
MDTPAQKRAKNNYQKKVKVIRLQFYPNNDADTEMYEFLKAQTNTTQFLKKLVKRDMEQE